MVVDLADDILLTVVTIPNRVAVDNAGAVTVEPQPEIKRDASHLFWTDGESWQSGLQAWPDPPAIFAQLGLDEMLETIVLAHEVEGNLDRAMVRNLLTVLLILIVVALIVTMVAVIIILLATSVITAGTASALIPIVTLIAEFLVGAAFTAGQAAIDATVATVTGSAIVGQVFLGYSGRELSSRLSPYRFHRVLYLNERPIVAANASNTDRLSLDVTESGITEVFRSFALGGQYRFTVVCSAE